MKQQKYKKRDFTRFCGSHDYIKRLIDEHKYTQAQKIIGELLDKYPHDFYLYNYLIRIYLANGMFEDAKKMLDYTDEEYIFLEKTIIALKEHDMPTLEDLYSKYYNKYYLLKLDKMTAPYVELKTQVKTLMGEKICDNNLDYYKEQHINYSVKRAIEYIKKSQNNYDECDYSRAFRDTINIEDLFVRISDLIKRNYDKSFISCFREIYLIHYPDCAYDDKYEQINYIRVATIIGTSNILYFYPTIPRSINNVIEYEQEKKEQEELMDVKRLSRIDQFNKRYGIIENKNN